MKYSIFTAANRSYFPFLDMFITSCLENCDDNLHTIYVADSGLGEFREYISSRPKVKLLNMNLTDTYSGVHSAGWMTATQSKTRGLRDVLQSGIDHPLVMIDSDVCVLQDISRVIDPRAAIQATVMSDGGHRRSDGIFISEIACFTCFNDIEISKKFVDRWIDRMTEYANNNIDRPHETPAFNECIRELESEYIICSLDENTVCADQKIFDKTLAVHFKSNGSTSDSPLENFTRRIGAAKNYSNIDYNFFDYLNQTELEKWMRT